MSPEPAAVPAVFSAGVDKALKDTLAAVPLDKTRRVTGGITTRGVEGTFGWRVGQRGDVAAYAAKEWGSGWTAGARGSWSF